jgi:hypothetical protein
MDAFRPYFSLIEGRRDWSAAWRLDHGIPKQALARIANYEFSETEEFDAMERAMNDPGLDGAYLAFSRAALVLRHQGEAAYKAELAKIDRRPELDDDPVWKQLWGLSQSIERQGLTKIMQKSWLR